MTSEDTQVAPNTGQTWKHSEGDSIKILGRRSRGWVIRNLTNDESGEIPDLTDFAWVSCEHEHYCCPSHSSHARPHAGCILR